MKYTRKPIILLISIILCAISVACATGNALSSPDATNGQPADNTTHQPAHAHAAADQWTSDEQAHWNTCECGEVMNRIEHHWSEWQTTQESGCLTEGSSQRSCSDCGYIQMQPLPAIGSHRFIDGICEACGENEPSEGFAFELNTDGGYTVVGIGSCTDTELIIPSEYLGKPVTAIGERAFAFCDNLTAVTLGSNIASIEASAFFGCTRLTAFTAEAGLLSIGAHAFEACVSLGEVDLPDGLVSIDWGAFYSCISLKEISIPRSVAHIAYFVFANCDALKVITVESGNEIYHSNGNCLIETASKVLIAGCGASVIPTDGSVTAIGAYAFYDCDGLIVLELPDGITSISERAYYACPNLTAITLPASIELIEDAAFESCSDLRTIIVDSDNTVYHSEGNCLIETASKTLLVGCQTSIIPSDGSVTSIAPDAFYNCDRLVGIIIPDAVREIGEGSFAGCTALVEAIFENTDGWTIHSDTAEAVTPDLTSPAAAADCLVNLYKDSRWTLSH